LAGHDRRAFIFVFVLGERRGTAIAPTGGNLSKQLDNLLLSELARADPVATYART
jgi:hypothetical protein